jgi:hypothetical protein
MGGGAMGVLRNCFLLFLFLRKYHIINSDSIPTIVARTAMTIVAPSGRPDFDDVLVESLETVDCVALLPEDPDAVVCTDPVCELPV